VHLDESQREDENILSVDYDVWKDEDTGYLQIEKYNPKHHAIKCPECDYQTLRLIREEVVRQPTATENGIMVKHYRCSYCKHLAKKTVELKPAVPAENLAAAT
jgi:DNA-directed RNA polymerase subunit RPC12/RpoP